MAKKQKLELTWIGKENRPKLEPRILLEDSEKSYHAKHRVTEKDIFDNQLIFGDNLLALKALEQKFAGKVKCVYIDPPFNTGQAFDHYDDGVEHSIWLSLMRDRVKILYKLLSNDGVFWIHLDDNEVHYMKVMLDEIFGRENFINQITYERSGSAGLGQGGIFVDTGEYLLFYKKRDLNIQSVMNSMDLELKVMKRYNKILVCEGEKELIQQFDSKSNSKPVKIYKHKNYELSSISLRDYEKRKEAVDVEYSKNYQKIFRTTNPQKENVFQNEIISFMEKDCLYSMEYIPSRGKYKDEDTTLYYYNKEIFAWLKDSAQLIDGQVVKTNKLTNIWAHGDIPKADLANEGGINFKRGKKPENLIKRILEMSTSKGDLVLDSFAGSGTTGAVAHKMSRRWIMVELAEQCHTHIIPRLKRIIDNSDTSGISKTVSWKGGGGFRYYHLAPSLLEKDKWGNWIISKKYNPAQLAEAVCKLEGFTYAPSDSIYWQHGHSTERDFIYVTTQNLNHGQLQQLSDEVGEGRSLLVLCSAFRGKADRYPNLTIKKIPRAVLTKCEWGHDDYSLNVENLPDAPPEPLPQTVARKRRSVEGQQDLFEKEEGRA